MQSPVSITCHTLTRRMQNLTVFLQRIQKYLLSRQRLSSTRKETLNLIKLQQQTKQMEAMIQPLLTVPIMILNENEFMKLCDLLICGSEMAGYINGLKRCSKTMRCHTIYWQKIVKTMRPLLKQNIKFNQGLL